MTPATLERPTSSPPAAPPARSGIQRDVALHKANRIRTHRARLKRDLKAGRTTVHAILLGFDERDDLELLASMKVQTLILAAPKYGRVKVNRLLVTARISPSKTLGGMTARQRAELVCLVRR